MKRNIEAMDLIYVFFLILIILAFPLVFMICIDIGFNINVFHLFSSYIKFFSISFFILTLLIIILLIYIIAKGLIEKMKGGEDGR